MVTNIDDNMGRLIHALKTNGIYEHTILVFLTDDGPQHNRYKQGLRERKGSVYQGGIRVPCFIHYPEKFKEKREVDAPVAHIDLLPSILDLCGLKKPEHQIDGLSIFSSEEDNYAAFWNRALFFEWGRGFLQKYRNIAVIKGHDKLVGNTGYQSGIERFELYDLQNDPQEKENTGNKNTETAELLKSEWDNWYDEIISEKNSNQKFSAYIGTPFENPVILNRNDARGTPVAWQQENVLNHWDVRAPDDGQYDITYHFIKPLEVPGKVCLQLYPYNLEEHGVTPGTTE
jgi:arylsulfatase A-like enzyme